MYLLTKLTLDLRGSFGQIVFDVDVIVVIVVVITP